MTVEANEISRIRKCNDPSPFLVNFKILFFQSVVQILPFLIFNFLRFLKLYLVSVKDIETNIIASSDAAKNGFNAILRFFHYFQCCD